MSQAAARTILPVYLLLCLILGGSNHGIWLSAVLQIGGVLLVGLVAAGAKDRLSGPSRSLVALVMAALLLVILQLVPLSPELWTSLPGRQPITDGYEALGLAQPWLPLSMAPYATLGASFYALPFVAVLLSVILVRQLDCRWVVAVLVLGTLAGIALGALQTADGESWKIYSITNTGAVGFFANRNFFGTLLVMNIPFAVALMGSGKLASTSASWTLRALGAAYLLVVLVGIVLNRSMAAALIAVPVSMASLALLPFRLGWKRYVGALGVLIAIALTALLMSGSLRSEIIGSDTVSIQTRTVIWSQTLKIASDSFPFGTGLGSFRDMYAFHEDPLLVDRFYVNNAHNDYLELFMETGVPGILLVGAFLAWWLVQAKRIWQSTYVDLIARAATIASAAVLAHSIVDYPLRTAAISSIFAFCLGAMAIFGATSGASFHPGQRHARHVRIA